MSSHDVELWRRLLAGDESALEEISAEYVPTVSAWLEHTFAKRLLYGEAEDVMQEALLAVWLSCGKFDPAKGKLSAWFAGIAHHAAFKRVNDGCAQERRREELRDSEELDALPWGLLGLDLGRAEAEQGEIGGDESARRRFRRENLPIMAEMLAALSADEQAVWRARSDADCGTSCGELAAQLGLNPNTFRSHLKRARGKIAGECVRRGLPAPNWNSFARTRARRPVCNSQA